MPVVDFVDLMPQLSESQFWSHPETGFLVGENWVYGAYSPSVFYLVLRGNPSGRDMSALVRVMMRELARAPHRTLVDVSQVGLVLPETFALLVGFFAQYRGELSRAVTDVAVVLPAGMARATVAGFFAVAPQPFPCSFYGSLPEAATEFCSTHVESFCETVADALRLQAQHRDVVARTTEQLRASSGLQTRDDVARSLGISERSLQRQLQLARVTFSQLLRDERLHRAKERLTQTQDSVTEVAMDLGFSSPQQLATLFKRAFGVMPSQFRIKKRG